MEKKKISLIKDINKVSVFKTKDSEINIINDERITNESNKILATAFNTLICILVLGSIIADIINLKINFNIIFIVIGIVSYIGLILMCKKNIIESNPDAGAFFIWSMFTLPISIFNCLDNFFNKRSDLLVIILELVVTIILIVFLYQIANVIYKKVNR